MYVLCGVSIILLCRRLPFYHKTHRRATTTTKTRCHVCKESKSLLLMTICESGMRERPAGCSDEGRFQEEHPFKFEKDVNWRRALSRYTRHKAIRGICNRNDFPTAIHFLWPTFDSLSRQLTPVPWSAHSDDTHPNSRIGMSLGTSCREQPSQCD